MGNSSCCPKHEVSLSVKEKIIIEDISRHSYRKVVKIQSQWRGHFSRTQTPKITPDKTKTKSKYKYEITTPGYTIERLKPGVDYNIEDIKINQKIINTENKLGEFVIDEKELIVYISQHKDKLNNHCLKHSDGSIYMGYYNNYWEREGYGILILPDGSKYQGFFKTNKMHGRGRLVGINGDYYEGMIILFT